MNDIRRTVNFVERMFFFKINFQYQFAAACNFTHGEIFFSWMEIRRIHAHIKNLNHEDQKNDGYKWNAA